MKFTKKDSSKLKKIGFSWRKPRGRKNKTKVRKKGHKPMPSKGFMSSGKERFRIAGKMPVRVHNQKELESLNDGNIVIIASAVGALKRKSILEACRAKNIRVINHERDAENAEKTGQ